MRAIIRNYEVAGILRSEVGEGCPPPATLLEQLHGIDPRLNDADEGPSENQLDDVLTV